MGAFLPRALGALVILILVLLVNGCSQQPRQRDQVAEPSSTEQGAVAFEIRADGDSGETQSWIALHSDSGKTSRFRIELNRSRRAIGHGMTFGKGQFVAQPDSDASALLKKLQVALEAKALPEKVTRVKNLPFEFVVLGEEMSRSQGGGFADEPSGGWTAMKLFLAGGEAEVFMNLNVKSGKGEFSIKDVDYGDLVIAELAKVL